MVETGVREAQLVFLSPCLPSGVPGMGIRNRSPEHAPHAEF